jgi:hemerythrin-like domain-containing protein
MNEIKPIRRSVELQPLSREHHDGLLFIWKLRQGLNYKIPTVVLRDYVSWYWKHHIKPHFFQEEKILLPYIEPAHPLAERLKTDHENIRDAILQIDREHDSYDLFWLCNLLESHIRFEEREFFAYLEQQLSAEQLSEIFTQLEQHPVSCKEEWKNQFWIRPATSS